MNKTFILVVFPLIFWACVGAIVAVVSGCGQVEKPYTHSGNSVYSSREQLDGAERALKEEPVTIAEYFARNGTPCKTSLCILDAMTHDRFKVEAVPKKVK